MAALALFAEAYGRLNYPLLIVEGDNIPVWANNRFLKLHRMSREALESPEGVQTVHAALTNAFNSGEYVVDRGEGQRHFDMVISQVAVDERKLSLISFFNISKRKQLQSALLEKQKMFEQLSENLPEGIVLFDGNIRYSNPAFERFSGYSGSELLAKRFEDLIDTSGLELFETNRKKLLKQGKSFAESVLPLKTKKGKNVWVRIKTSVLEHEDAALFLSIVTDISHEKSEMEKLTRLAFFDALTGIYNRRKFNELLLLEYKRAKRYNRHLCALFFDIDHFKRINDRFGHDIGDAVLKELSALVKAHVRETDCFARWGGEEFIVLLPETTVENAASIAEHIRSEVGGHSFPKVGNVTISIGITSLKGRERSDTFIKRLDNALYQAKREGRNRTLTL